MTDWEKEDLTEKADIAKIRDHEVESLKKKAAASEDVPGPFDHMNKVSFIQDDM